jgi:hypothetical protein
MKLSKEEADLFFKLMWGLQFYVNTHRHIVPAVTSVEAYATLPFDGKMHVRDALWEHPDLIDAYVAENPHGLSAEEVDIVREWKEYVSGRFQIVRWLKKYAIFIGEDARVYGVLGLYDSLEEIFVERPLPMLVQVVLLPFRGRIVYDGLVKGYTIMFGGGIRAELQETYLVAKQQGRILTTLEADVVEPVRSGRQGSSRGWRGVVDGLVETAEKLQGGSVVQSAAFALVRASARLTQAAVHHPDDVAGLWQLERQVRRALTRLQTTLDRAER